MKRIPLTRGYEAIVDDEDYEWLNQFKWYAKIFKYTYKKTKTVTTHIYAARGRKTIFMHSFLMNTPKWMQTDHINGNGLDNRKANLRICTRGQNQGNRVVLQKNNKSGFKGVYYSRNLNAWVAQITKLGTIRRCWYLGKYNNPVDAARAYDVEARKHFGEFAKLNFPQENK
jgi:hypothetical protein